VQPHKEWDAAAYQVLSDPQFGWGMKVLDRLVLRGDERVLDIGCGTGRLTAELLARLPRGSVTALDQSQNMVAEAEARLGPAHGERVSFLCHDALALGLREAFDLVFSTATFHWILDHDALFRAIFRALAPGGRLVAQCGGRGNIERLHDHVLEISRRQPFAPHFAGWSDQWVFAGPEETAARLSAAGFVDVRTSLEDTPTPFPDADAYRAFVERIVVRHFLARLPSDDLRRAFMDEIVAGGAAREPRFTLDYCRLNIEARRAP
jgi:trans-aconitate methyltransferase